VTTRKKKPTTSLVRSSAAEYLTFAAASGAGGLTHHRSHAAHLEHQPLHDHGALLARGGQQARRGSTTTCRR